MSQINNQDSLAHQAVVFLEELLMRHDNPPLPPALSTIKGFSQIYSDICSLKSALYNFSIGKFEHDLPDTGITAGYVRTLQENIDRLAGQCRLVAGGDLTQRADFMGGLSDAFNRMTESLAAQHQMLEQKQSELTKLTKDLQNEMKKKEEMEAALRASEEMYRQRSLRDPLTGLYNRSYFFESASREMENLKRHKDGSCCVMMMDIDHFKKFNDAHGHLCGDQAIKMVANTIDQSLRKSDIFARYGGEEFSLFLAGTDLEKGTTIAERIRITVSSQPTPAKNDQTPITISIGLYCVESAKLNPLTPGNKILLEALSEADAALYTAKEKGRNMVWVANK